ncbi:MAG: cell division protein FtsZ [Hyphomicrobiaceae bacterium]
MSINLQLPKLTDLKPRITVIGVGGAGGNAVNNMIASGLAGVEYIVANTDAQALQGSSAERRIQLGISLTEGLGAGSKPEVGQAAAEEAIEEIKAQIVGSHMVFIAAGMGGGTGTGAAAVIARAAKEANILTVGIVTKPFQFEGTRRARIADAGIAELRKYVDTLIVIPNQNLFRVANEKTTFAEAFILADQVLYSGIACIVDLIVKEGLINLDFADVRTVMSDMGSAMMGTGEANGERRAIRAAEEAIANPLLDEVSLKGAKGLLLSIIGGRDMTLYEVDEAASRVRQEVDPEANIIVGATFDDSMGDRVRVAIVASGLATVPNATTSSNAFSRLQAQRPATPQIQAPAATPPPPGPAQPNHAASAPPHSPFPPAPVAPPQPASAAPKSYPAQPPRQAGPNLPPPVPIATSPRQNREVWRAPGDVIIEESVPAAGFPPAPREAPPAAPAPQPHETFTPGPPEDFQRTGRRLPEVDDFPVVGQREYRAKAGQYAEPPAGPPRVYDGGGNESPPQRGGIFQRIVAAGRGRDAEKAGNGTDANREGRRREAPQLPFFFNKDKR